MRTWQCSVFDDTLPQAGGAEKGNGASDRARTGDIQNHNLAL